MNTRKKKLHESGPLACESCQKETGDDPVREGKARFVSQFEDGSVVHTDQPLEVEGKYLLTLEKV